MMKLVSTVINLLIKLMVCLATATLAAMMFLMASDVICRYFFNSPISGGLELIEYMMAIIVPLSVAYCALQGAHVSVELLVDRLSPLMQKILKFITSGLSIVFVGLISWQNFLYIGEMHRSHMTSAVLRIPTYPFVAATAVGMCVFAIVMVIQLFPGKSEE
jgi:TRAP-type C4-dicarboxylate transport system permease small subunit